MKSNHLLASRCCRPKKWMGINDGVNELNMQNEDVNDSSLCKVHLKEPQSNTHPAPKIERKLIM